MNYEEKYKKLVDAIKEMRDVNPSDEGLQNWVQDNVPELAKSEDEKIRKALIRYFTLSDEHAYNEACGVSYIDILAWLEKQGTSYTKRDVDDAYLKGISDTKNEVEKQYEADYQIRKDIATFIFNYRGDIKDRAKWMNYLGIKVYVYDRQDEKPQGKTAFEAIKEEKVDNANKVEPKFHEGDWIVNDYCVGKIIALTDDAYLLDTEQYIPFSYEHNAHLWTIKDAKPGDVLASECCDSIILFKGIKDNNIDFYCDYDFSEIDSKVDVTKDRFAINNRGEHYGSVEDSEDFHPATKEQRCTLMQAMTNAGWQFDFEKKELKKIEPKSDAWTEKDKIILEGIIDEIEADKDEAPSYALPTYDKYLNWLKSLRNKIKNE